MKGSNLAIILCELLLAKKSNLQHCQLSNIFCLRSSDFRRFVVVQERALVSNWLIWIWCSSFEIIAPPCCTKVTQRNSSTFKKKFCYNGTQEIEYLDHTTILYVKKYMRVPNYSGGGHRSPRPPSDQAVYIVWDGCRLYVYFFSRSNSENSP